MTALDFPSSPTDGQTYGSYFYDATKGAWRSSPASSMAAVPSPTPPSNPIPGNLWLNTNDGVLFVYYNDGDTAQWIEVKSNTGSGSTVAARVDTLETAGNTTNKSGLVPIVPTTVTVGSGSASVSAAGVITYAGASSLNLNGIFTSTYTNYRITFNHILTADTGLNLRLRVGGTDSITAVYNNHHAYWGTGGNGANIIANHTVFGALFGHGKQRGVYELYAPQLATRTAATFFGAAENGSGATEQHTSSVFYKADTQFDGVTVFPTGGTFTGTVRIYGYN